MSHDRHPGPTREPSTLSRASYGTITEDEHSSLHTTEPASNENGGRRRKRRLPKPALTLVNSGSVARDHLASERTFLAYVRTSLAISSMGVALIQLFRLSPVSRSDMDARWHRHTHLISEALGGVLILTGLLTLFIGLFRFFAVQDALLAGKFPASRILVLLPASILVLAISVVFGLLVVYRAGAS